MTESGVIRHIRSLNALRAFEVSARCMSFTKAAGELSVTQSAVSRHVKVLEDQLGALLFVRRRGGLELTEDGAMLLPHLTDAFNLIAHAANAVASRRRDLRLRILPGFATRWLIPRLPRFEALRPDIHIRLTTSWWQGGAFDSNDFDAWIAYGDGAWPNMRADLIAEERLVPVCAPRLLDGGGPYRWPDDLRRFPLLHSTPDHVEWQRWIAALGLSDIDVSAGLDFDLLEATVQAALRGYGVALLDSVLVAEELDAERLVVPFSFNGPAIGAYYFVYNEAIHSQSRLIAFRDWLLDEVHAARTVEAVVLGRDGA